MHIKQKRAYIRAISLLTFLSLIFGVATVVYAVKAQRYKFLSEVSSQRAVSELCQSLDNITVSLQKSIYTGTQKKLLETGNELSREASIAKVCLSQLTDENIVSDEIYKFLSQVGAYTVFITNSKPTESNRENLRKLYSYSLTLSDEMSKVRDGYFDGSISLQNSSSTIDTGEEVPSLFSDAVNDVEQSLTDYPTLIYDGPFADNLINKTSVFLKEQKEISKQQAKEIAAKLLSLNSAELRSNDDINGEMELYSFSKGDLDVSITKKGGFVTSISNPYSPGEDTISAEQAVSAGKDYLEKIGYTEMSNTYYSVYDGICTVNFAYKTDDIIYYPDLIKVGVALDTGEVVSLDASPYLMNHHKRSLKEKTLTSEDAVKMLSPSLSVISVSEAVIPLDTGKEAYCHEIHCKDKSGQQALVYFDCNTGEEQDILILLYSDDGILTK